MSYIASLCLRRRRPPPAASPPGKCPPRRSPREALSGAWEHPAVHWGEVISDPISMSVCCNSERPLDNHHRAAREYRHRILSIALQLIHGTTEGPPGGPGPVFPSDQSIHMWPRVWRTTLPCSMKPDVARKPKRWKLAPWLSGQSTLRKIRLSDGPYVRFWLKADSLGPCLERPLWP